MATVTHPVPSRTLRVPRPVLWGGGIATALIIAVAAFLAWFNWDMLRAPLAARASALTGRNVRIDGHLVVRPWSLTPSATVTGLKIGNPAWMGGGDTADIDQLSVAVRLWPLLSGDLEVPLVHAERPSLWLYRDASGRVNWQFGRSGQPAKLPPIQRFVIDDGHVTYVDRARSLTIVGTMQSTQSGDGRGAFHLVGKGRLNDNGFLITIAGAPLINVRHDRPYPFAATIRAGATHVLARGELPKPFDFGLIRADLALSGQNFADLYDLTGLAFPNTPPYHLNGELVRDGSTYTFHKVTGLVGSSDLEGMFRVEHRDGRPDLHATLQSRRMTIADLGTLLGAPPAGPAKTPAQQADAARLAGQGRLLPDAQLAVARVRAMDADVHYRAASVQAGPHLPLTGFSLHLILDHGVMTADPVAFDLPHGSLAGRVRVDARRGTPTTDLDMRLTNIRAEDFFRTSASPPLTGLVEARARLHGIGGSVHDAASTADGSVAIVRPARRDSAVPGRADGRRRDQGAWPLSGARPEPDRRALRRRRLPVQPRRADRAPSRARHRSGARHRPGLDQPRDRDAEPAAPGSPEAVPADPAGLAGHGQRHAQVAESRGQGRRRAVAGGRRDRPGRGGGPAGGHSALHRPRARQERRLRRADRRRAGQGRAGPRGGALALGQPLAARGFAA
jgi:AsmA family protein